MQTKNKVDVLRELKGFIKEKFVKKTVSMLVTFIKCSKTQSDV